MGCALAWGSLIWAPTDMTGISGWFESLAALFDIDPEASMEKALGRTAKSYIGGRPTFIHVQQLKLSARAMICGRQIKITTTVDREKNSYGTLYLKFALFGKKRWPRYRL